MAGARGLTSQNFKDSIRIGGVDHTDACGRSRSRSYRMRACKMQMEQGTHIPTLHPLKLLALSYGLMPEIQQRLQPSRRKLVDVVLVAASRQLLPDFCHKNRVVHENHRPVLRESPRLGRAPSGSKSICRPPAASPTSSSRWRTGFPRCRL